MEVIDIGLDDIDADLNSNKPSVNFGTGIEFLMNDKQRKSSGGTKIDLADLDNLEDELNALSGVSGSNTPTQGGGGTSKKINTSTSSSGLDSFTNFFSFGNSSSDGKQNENITLENTDSNIGAATAESIPSNSKTWDGFMKMGGFSSAPSDTRNGGGAPSNSTGGAGGVNMTERERRRKKRLMIKKLEEWYQKGIIKDTTHFNMDSNYEEIEDEYEGALEDKRKKDSIKLQGWWFTTFVNTIEYGNAFLNPFDLNLDGWGEQVSEDLDSYEEIFAELHDKYKGGKMAPELSLLLRLGFSAAVVNMSNKMLSSATPGFGDVMKQSPELMRMFTNAAVDTMSKQSPTFEFAKNMMNPPEQVNTRAGPPPAPVETKNMGNIAQRPMAPSTNFGPMGAGQVRPGPGQGMQFTGPGGIEAPINAGAIRRPDLAAASMFSENIPSNFNTGGGSSGNERNGLRPEMKGPQTTDIENILSGLKTKPKEEGSFPMNTSSQNMNNFFSGGDDSMISVTSLRDLDGGNVPKRTKKPRKNNSEKNTVSLDI